MRNITTDKHIVELKTTVATLLPDGWEAGQCIMLSLSGNSSPEMVDVRRKGFREALLATPREGRAAFREAWNSLTIAQAKQIEATLREAGIKNVLRDYGSIYVKLWGATAVRPTRRTLTKPA